MLKCLRICSSYGKIPTKHRVKSGKKHKTLESQAQLRPQTDSMSSLCLLVSLEATLVGGNLELDLDFCFRGEAKQLTCAL